MGLSSEASVAARDRLAAVLAPDVLDALEELVAERVAAGLAALEASRTDGPAWLTLGTGGRPARLLAGRGADAGQPWPARPDGRGAASTSRPRPWPSSRDRRTMRRDNEMAPARREPPEARPRKGYSRDAVILDGSPSRRPVYTGDRRVPGLYERTLADGSTVYDAAFRLGGKVRRHRLEARTKTDAIAELRALQVDHARGEPHRSPAAGLTLAELARDYLAHCGRARTRPTRAGAVRRARWSTTTAATAPRAAAARAGAPPPS